MLTWERGNEDENLQEIIDNCKKTFNDWFERCWSKRCSRERMLSAESPLEHVYYKMCLTFEEVKKKLPSEGKKKCSSCDNETSEWIETLFSFCDEYDCGMVLCKDCAKELYEKIGEWLNESV